jgi:hypothetical protein
VRADSASFWQPFTWVMGSIITGHCRASARGRKASRFKGDGTWDCFAGSAPVRWTYWLKGPGRLRSAARPHWLKFACASFRLGSPRFHEPEDHSDVADALVGQRYG